MIEQCVKQIAQCLWHLISDKHAETSCTLLVFVGVFFLVKIIQWLRYNTWTLPPGPWGIPIWGYLPFIKGAPHLHYNELAKKYGSVFSIRLGSELVVFISDHRIIRDLFRREEFSGRPHTDFMNIIDGYGIVNTEGVLWKDQRKFLHEQLRHFGITHIGDRKKNMNTKIMGEVQILLQEFTKSGGAPISLSSFLAVSISNIICSLTMNVRFRHDDSRFKRFMDLIDEGFILFASLSSANYISCLRHLPWIHTIRDKISKNREEMAKFFQDIIDEHKATYDENNIRDIVDAYLFKIQQAENENRDHELFEGKNKNRQMQQIMGDLFSAGMETVKNTLEWSVIFMLHHPEAAKAVQDELDQIIGRSKLPSLDDIPFLPITNATIQEILRTSNVVALGPPHATTRNTKLDDYTLPAGTHVIPLMYSLHMNPELWNDPEVFRPSRFLTNEGKIYKPEFFIPFGVGRRMCLGDTLARMELFLFFSSLMHKFNLSLPEGAALPSLHGNIGVTLSPRPFKVCLQQRDFDLVDCGSNDTTNGPLRNIGSH